jgi:hypothetical protein
MLHSYELGVLSSEEAREFEKHVLDCESCFEEMKEMLPTSTLLRHDPDVRAVSNESVEKKFRFSKLMLIAAVLLISFVPIYRYVIMDALTSEVVQQVNLLPVRGAGDDLVELELGGTAEIRFYVKGATTASFFQVVIRSDQDDVVFSEDHFSDFTDFGAGLIVLPVSSLSKTTFVLTITESPEDTARVVAEYRFRAF